MRRRASRRFDGEWFGRLDQRAFHVRGHELEPMKKLLTPSLLSMLAPACASSQPCSQAVGEIRQVVRDIEGDSASAQEIMKDVDRCLASSDVCAIVATSLAPGRFTARVIAARSAKLLPKQLPSNQQLIYMLLPVKTAEAAGCVFAQSGGRADPWFARGWLSTAGKLSEFVLKTGYDVEYAKRFPFKKQNAATAEMGPAPLANVLMNQFDYCVYRATHPWYACE